jgi:transcriptional regulator with XRE-family HTH domain
MTKPQHPLKTWRLGQSLTLDQLCNRIEAVTGYRPSKATLSRIETGDQPVSENLIPVLRTLTGLSIDELRPDLAPAPLAEGAAA